MLWEEWNKSVYFFIGELYNKLEFLKREVPLANDSKIEGSKTPLTIYKNEENRIRLDQHFKTARQTGTNVELKLWSKTSA